MAHVSQHRNTPREVAVMFEPTRFAQDALRLAYAALVPPPTKRLNGMGAR